MFSSRPNWTRSANGGDSYATGDGEQIAAPLDGRVTTRLRTYRLQKAEQCSVYLIRTFHLYPMPRSFDEDLAPQTGYVRLHRGEESTVCEGKDHVFLPRDEEGRQLDLCSFQLRGDLDIPVHVSIPVEWSPESALFKLLDVVVQVLGTKPGWEPRRIDQPVEQLCRGGCVGLEPDVFRRVAAERVVDCADRSADISFEFRFGDTRLLEVDDIPEVVAKIFLPRH